MKCERCGGNAADPPYRSGCLCLRCEMERQELVKKFPYVDRFHWSEYMPDAPQIPVAGRKSINLNDERDEFVYQQRIQKVENKVIRKQVNKTKGWRHVGTDQAVNGIVARYCKRKNLPRPVYKNTKIKHD